MCFLSLFLFVDDAALVANKVEYIKVVPRIPRTRCRPAGDHGHGYSSRNVQTLKPPRSFRRDLDRVNVLL